MKMIYLFCIICIILVSCLPKDEREGNNETGYETEYAVTFDIRKHEGFHLVEITKPWQNSGNEKFSYVLAGHGKSVPDTLSHLDIIRTPVESVICFSTTHIGFISALQKTESIKGVSGKDFCCDTDVRRNIEEGLVYDVGYPPAINYETILKINPDVVFLYGLESSVTGIIKRLSAAGISSLIVSDYLETHPLGKAEWIKFFASLFELEDRGDSIFNKVAENYNALINIAGTAQNKPKVLTGLPWKETWFMAGGRSFTARFIEDAGGDYLYKENPSDEFIPLSLESVYNTSANADIWINCGTAVSLNDLLSRDKRFNIVRAIQQGRVYNNNARMNNTGGNDFWESGTVRADIILKDLISIFHPGIIGDHELVYYRRME